MTLDDLRGEDGVLDPQRATAAIDRVLAERPHWAIPAPAPPEPTRLDVHGGAREPPPPPPLSFGQAIRDSRLTG